MTIERKQRLHLGITMVLVAISVGAISLYFSYQAAVEEKGLGLIDMAKSRARVMEAVAQFDLKESSDFQKGSFEVTLSKFREAHIKFEGFGKTGEFVLAKQEEDKFVFLFKTRHTSKNFKGRSNSIPIESPFAEPMRRALRGESGTVMGLDYRGEIVLAAYEPVAILNIGLVAKIDIAEIRTPFIKAGILALIGGGITILLGLIVFFRVSEPLIKTIKDLQERYERAIKGSKDGLWDWPDINKDEQWWCDDWYGLLGLKNDEIKASYSGFKSLLHPDDLSRVEEALKNHFQGKDEYEVSTA